MSFIAAILQSVQAALVPSFELFRHDETAIALSLLLVIAGLAFVAVFWLRRMRPLQRELADLTHAVRHFRDEAAFASGFDRIDTLMSETPLVSHGWQEFRSSLILPAPGSDEPIRNTLRPYAFINAAAAEAAGLNLQFQRALPNFFVGFGLLFTFIGLVAALYFANQGVASPDIAVAQQALRDLLHAATFKFMTSVAGLGMSLLIAITNRILLHRMEIAFTALCEALEQRLAFVTAESIAIDQLRETRRQTSAIESFRGAFAEEVAGALDSRLATSLPPALRAAQEPLAQTIGSLADNLQDVNKEAMAEMAAKFIETLRGAAGVELKAIARTIAELNGDLDHLLTKLANTGDGFATRVDTASGRLESLIGAAAQTLHGAVDESADRLRGTVEAAAGNLSGSVGGASEALRGSVEAASASLRDSIGQAMGALREDFHQASSGLLENARDAAKGLGEGVARATGDLERTLSATGEEAARVVDGATRGLSDGLDGTVVRMDRLLAPLAARLEALEGTFTELDGRVRAQFEAFERSVVSLDGSLAALNQGAGALRAAAEPVAEATGELRRAGEQVAGASREAARVQGGLEGLAGALEQSTLAMRGAWDDYRQRFEDLDASLAATLRGIAEGAEQSQRGTRQFVVDLDSQLRRALVSLADTVEKLEERLEEVADGLEELGGVLRQAKGV